MTNIFENPEVLVASLANFIVAEAKMAIVRGGRFDLVLSGGNSPQKLYQLLASETYREQIEWQKVFFFFGDERYVPADHAESNFRMVDESLFTPLRISGAQVFAINTTLSPGEAARDYEQRIIRHFGNRDCHFDLILLGLGDNAHTASLFPHTDVLHEASALIKDVYVEGVKMYRITFTAGLINLARTVVFLVYGASKADAVLHVLRYPTNIEVYPAQLIHPENGMLYWFLDQEAAGKIENDR